MVLFVGQQNRVSWESPGNALGGQSLLYYILVSGSFSFPGPLQLG